MLNVPNVTSKLNVGTVDHRKRKITPKIRTILLHSTVWA